ncbi:hydrogen gas-evolving membrane-bound hydrogenase subunit E [Methanosalsum natronophilum]|nr:hydrogen gas-evolving membrane-bound hydrogenase subunit E [Methanosalsum natronophilum]MCS3924188.1 multicomponent Na+:H+ antiporter subunit A [Methanosalsum natronophilum]
MNLPVAVVLAIFLPFFFAILVPYLERIVKHNIGWFSALIGLISFLLLVLISPEIIRGEVIHYSVSWIPSVGVDFGIYVDGLSLLIAFLASGIGFLIMAYSTEYMSHREDLARYYQYILLFMGSMIGMVFASNTIQLFIFWELTSITSFLLIGFWRNKPQSVYGAKKSLILTAGFGGLALLTGILLLRAITGTFDIPTILADESLKVLIKEHDLFLGTLFLIFIGAAAKSAQGPFYIWLPNAMEAPTPVSAFLHSATMVKAGLYLIGRVHPIFSGTEAWLIMVAGTGLVTMVVAGFLALRQTDIKGLLAYSTISQLAYIMAMYGYTTYQDPSLGVVAATYHLLNHATFKATLFLIVGIVAHEAATRDIKKLGGLRKEMPITFVIATIGALSMAGVPPLNGFLSKEMFYEASVDIGASLGQPYNLLIPMIAVIAGVLTFAYSIKIIDGIFLGKRNDEHLPKKVHDPSIIMLGPAAILAFIVVLFGIFPSIPMSFIIEPAVSGIILEDISIYASLWHGFTVELLMTVVTFGLGIIIYKKYDAIANWQDEFNKKHPTFSLNYYYDEIFGNATENAKKISLKFQVGPIRAYLFPIVLIAILSVLFPIIILSVELTPITFNFETPPYELIVFILIITTAVMAAIIPSYLPAVIAVSALGFLIGIVFIFLLAPDLAITQILAETLTTIIFVLVISKVPQTFKEKIPRNILYRDILISLTVASTVFLIMLYATQGIIEPFESVSHYFLEKSILLTGGHNIVNVILVDFRSLDTLGEIVVIFLAALGVYNLLHSRGERK